MQKVANKERVVVVGGGVIGCAAAFECAQAGYDVTLVERDAIAAHASGNNAGNINPLIGTPTVQRDFALHAYQLQLEVYRALDDIGCADYALAPVKRVHLGYDESERSHLEEIAAACETDKRFPVRWLDRASLHKIEPRLAPDARFGILTEGSFSISSSDFTWALARGAIRLGAKIVMGAVTGIRSNNDRAVMIETADGAIACDSLVLATGPWVSGPESWLGIRIPVAPVKGQMLRLRLVGDSLSHDFTWQSIALYKRQRNELWVGGTMEHCGLDATATIAAKDMLLEQAAHILPAVREAALLEHTAALRPMTESGECVVGRADGWRNVYLANGGGAKGVLFSTGIARTLRRLLQQDSTAGVPSYADA